MNVEDAVVEHLAADAGVVALVGQRVFQLKLPPNAPLPAIRVQLIDEPTTYHLRGQQQVTRARIQTDAYAEEDSGVDPYAEASAVAAAVHTALSGQMFAAAGSPASIQVTGAFRDSRSALYEAEELRLVRVMQDYIVWSKHL